MSTVFFVVAAHLKPYISDSEDYIYTLSQCCILFSLFASLCFYYDVGKDEGYPTLAFGAAVAAVNMGAGAIAVTSDAFFIATSWELLFLAAGVALLVFASFRGYFPETGAWIERRCAPARRAYERLRDKVFHRNTPVAAAAPPPPPEAADEWHAMLGAMKHNEPTYDVEMEVFRDRSKAEVDEDTTINVHARAAPADEAKDAGAAPPVKAGAVPGLSATPALFRDAPPSPTLELVIGDTDPGRAELATWTGTGSPPRPGGKR